MTPLPPARLRLALAALALAALPLAPSVASADSTPPACSTSFGTQVYLPLLDARYYIPVPGGAFEAGTAPWTLTGGAAVVAGDDLVHIGGTSEAGILQLPTGAQAVSPAMCIDITMPTIRYVVRADRPGATLKLESSQDGASWQPVASYTSVWTGWSAPAAIDFTSSLKMKTVAKTTSAVSFRLTASGGTFQVDDVFVDPFIWR